MIRIIDVGLGLDRAHVGLETDVGGGKDWRRWIDAELEMD